MATLATPALSVVVGIVSDTMGKAHAGHLAHCLEALSGQLNDSRVEVIVPHLEHVDGIDEVKRRFPDVCFVPVDDIGPVFAGNREHHDVLRARGLLAARGELLALLEDHARPESRFCANIIAAHRDGYAGIGGAIENGINRALNWAVYFCDFARYQLPLASGESAFASDANVSYKRSKLYSVRTSWEKSFREVIVNGELRSRGEKVALHPDIVVYQHRCDLNLFRALQERFIWGRSYAATRNAQLIVPRRVVYALLTPALPLVLTARIAATAWKRRRRFGKFLRTMHLIVLLQTSWSLGECVGYLRGVRPQ
jgi:hypothetical protein